MINFLIEIIATILDIVFLIWFIPNFNHTKFYVKPYTLGFPVLLLFFQIMADHFLNFYDFLYMLLFWSLILCYAISINRGRWFRASLSACCFVSVLMLSNSLVYTVFSLCIEDIDLVIQGSVSSARIIYLIICKLLHFSIFKLILRVFHADETLDLKNSLLVFLFTIMTAIGLGALMAVAISFDSDKMDVPILTIVVILLLSNCALYFMIYQVQKLLKTKYELKLVQEKMAFEKSRMEEANVVWRNIRRVRHDLMNHFSVISSQLKKGDAEGCQQYIDNLSSTVENMGNLICSNNSVLDYLINSKLSNLGEIQVLVSGYVGNLGDIEDSDLACIIGNILDNAVEAQKKVTKAKKIELRFLNKNSNRIIICKNTIETSVLKNNRMLRSTKRNPENHGLGHQIVETAVKKYHGWVNYFEEGNMFGVQIILPAFKETS